jgi:cell division septum initiation protein DivIVA
VTKLLQQAIAKIEQLTPEEQDKIAIRLLDELTNNNDDNVNFDDDEWDRQMKNDWANGKLNQLIEKAEADIKANKVKEIARLKLNNLPPQQAQKIVNDVLFANKWQPDLSNFNWHSSLWDNEDEET